MHNARICSITLLCSCVASYVSKGKSRFLKKGSKASYTVYKAHRHVKYVNTTSGSGDMRPQESLKNYTL